MGQGEYGIVHKALVIQGQARWPVALKTSKTESSWFEKAQEDLLVEGEVMAKLPYNENIANLQGVTLEETEEGESRSVGTLYLNFNILIFNLIFKY